MAQVDLSFYGDDLSPHLLDATRCATWSAGGARGLHSEVAAVATPVFEVAAPYQEPKRMPDCPGGTIRSCAWRISAAPSLHNARETPSLRNVRETLNALSDYSKARRAAKRARRLFVRDLRLALTTAFWITLIALPITVPSWAEALVSIGNGAYVEWWGIMLMNVVCSLYQDLGNTVKFSLQGLFGLGMALTNMIILMLPLSIFFGGGAHRDLEQMPGGWLPLCRDAHGAVVYERLSTYCLLNVAWDEFTLIGMLKVLAMLVDFVIFVVIVLSHDFDNNTRAFALSWHCYFMITFVNPTDTSWSDTPNVGWLALISALAGAVAAVLCCLFPRRIYALDYAEELRMEAVVAAGVLLESLPSIPSQLARQKAESAMAESEAIFSEFEQHIEDSWFEDFGRGRSALRRRRLRAYAQCLRSSILHVSGAHHIADALSEEDFESLEGFSSLRPACLAVRRLVENPASPERMVEVERCLGQISQDFHAVRTTLSPEAGAFVFAVRGIIVDTVQASKFYIKVEMERNWRDPSLQPRRSLSQKVFRFLRTLRSHFGITLDRSATHPRFVIRNATTLFITFLIGWVGVRGIIPPYMYNVSGVVSNVIYTFAGASAPLTLYRLNGIVIGRIGGTILQLAFAVKSWSHSCFFLVGIFSGVTLFEFLHHSARDQSIFSTGKTVGNTACLAGAYAVYSAMPLSGMFRNTATAEILRLSMVPRMFNVFVASVVGIGILTYVDVLFASRASTQARQRLQRTFKRARRFATSVFGGNTDLAGARRADVCKIELQEDLKALHHVIPFAAAEPMFWRQPFKKELYKNLEWSLRNIWQHIAMIEWATRLTESWLPTPEISRYGGLNPQVTPFFSPNSFMPTMQPATWLPSAAILSEQSFQQAQGQIQQELLLLMRSTEALVESVTRDAPQPNEVEDIRELLEQGLYTVKVAKYLRAGTSQVSQKVWSSGFVQRTTQALTAAFQQRSQQAHETNRDQNLRNASSQSCLFGLRSSIRQLISQIKDERLDWGANSPAATFVMQDDNEAEGNGQCVELGAEPFAATQTERLQNSSLEMLFECLRQAARSQEGAEAADEDACRMELLILLVKALFLEIHRMQLALLEY